jgi:hypothetical protein
MVPHIENILDRLRLKVDAAKPAGTALGLSLDQLEKTEVEIQNTIAKLASPDEARIPVGVPHDAFARWVRDARRIYPVEIFTTNYDVMLERSLERAHVPLFDGFVGSFEPYFSPDVIDTDDAMPGREWVRVWKVHGSVNWRLINHSTIRSYVLPYGDMILPSQRKYDQSRKMPYLALMDRFVRFLASDAALLVTCGYSWGDEHINATVLTALDRYPSDAVVALIHSSLDDVPQLVGFAETRNNLMVVGPREGVLRGQRKSWALPGDIDRATASFLDIAFDSDALLAGTAGPITGEVRLGDFNSFCRLLTAMHPSGPP